MLLFFVYDLGQLIQKFGKPTNDPQNFKNKFDYVLHNVYHTKITNFIRISHKFSFYLEISK